MTRPSPESASSESASSESDADRLYARVRADLDRERGVRAWLRARPTPLRVSLIVGASLVVALATAWVLVGGIGIRSTMGWVSAGGLVAALGVAVVAALSPIHRPRWGGGARKLLVVGIALASVAAIAASGDGSLGALAGGRCALIGIAVGAPVFGLSLLLARRLTHGVVFRGMAAGLAGALAIQLVCPAPGLAHLVVEHFGVLVAATFLFGIVGELIARRVS